MMCQVKCYDKHGRLWISKKLKKNSFQFQNAIYQAQYIIGTGFIFIKEKNTSTRLYFHNKKTTGSIQYIGFDGIKSWTIPILPKAYPVTAIDSNGNKKVIGL